MLYIEHNNISTNTSCNQSLDSKSRRLGSSICHQNDLKEGITQVSLHFHFLCDGENRRQGNHVLATSRNTPLSLPPTLSNPVHKQ